MHLILAFFLCQQDEIEQLKKRVAALEEEIKKSKGQEDEKLKKKVKKLEEDLENTQIELNKLKEKGIEKPSALNLLNPAITVFLNGAARVDSQTVMAGAGAEAAKIDDRMFLRSAEVDFRAAVDPYVDAVLIVALEQEPNQEFGVEVEEGYGVIKRLPVLESAPWGLRIKAGRYRAPLGFSNLLHMHDLPWSTRPQAVVEYLGSESGSSFFEAGYAALGSGILLRPPIFGEAPSSLDLEFHVVRAGQIRIGDESDNDQPAFLGRVGFFTKFADHHTLSAGVSGYFERGNLFAGLLGLEVLYAYKPPGVWNSIVVGGELFFVRREALVEEKDVDTMETVEKERARTPIGGYLFAQYQVSWHVYAGARYDYVQSRQDDDVETHVLAGYVSYYTSEYFRIRAGLEHRWSDVETEDGDTTLLVELNFVFGSHPPEPWWVYR